MDVSQEGVQYLLSASGETGEVDSWSSGGKEAEQEDEQEVKERHLGYVVRCIVYRCSRSECC